MAHNLGVSRSELFSTAVSEYINNHKYQSVTDRLNLIYNADDSKIDEKLVSMQWNSVEKEEW